MTTDEIIQLFRLMDLGKLRKLIDKLADNEKAILVKYLKRIQRS